MKSARGIATVGVATVLALSASACSGGGGSGGKGAEGGVEQGAGPAGQHVRLIGDGSTADTGPQPNQPKVKRLKRGEQPPQFVVFSWDGAGEDGQKLFSHFRKVAKENDASMTYFLSGVYVLPEDKRKLYEPPQHAVGASDIGYLDDEDIKLTLEQVRGAWLDGSEIGTHFNGHFCGPDRGVGTWTTEEWVSEIEQAESFVKNWKTNTGLTDMEPLPFDYSKELVGGRAPCLEGQENLIPAAKEMGFRYDASSKGGTQVWPKKIDGIWDFPLQQVPVPGRAFETLSMDYNFLANQSGTVRGDPAMHDKWEDQTREGLLAGFERAYKGNRAPMFIGNHFEQWNGGAYMRAVEDVIEDVCTKDEVRCVSFRQLADWLDAQDPEVLDALRTLEIGERPDWKALMSEARGKGKASKDQDKDQDKDQGQDKDKAGSKDEKSSAKNASGGSSAKAAERVERATERAVEAAERAARLVEQAEKADEAARKAAEALKALTVPKESGKRDRTDAKGGGSR